MCMFGFHITKTMKIQSETTFLFTYMPFCFGPRQIHLSVCTVLSIPTEATCLQCVSIYLHLTIIHIYVHTFFSRSRSVVHVWVYTCLSQVPLETLPAN